MWSDNAAEVDLLGYEDLIDDLVALVTDEALQPVTVGVFADWGSGKTTLLQLAGQQLRDRGELVVQFSPWLVEGYDDVKSCLLGKVIDAIEAAEEEHAKSAGLADKSMEFAKTLIGNLRRRVDWLRLARLAASAVVPIAGVALEQLDAVLRSDASGEASNPSIASTSAVSEAFHDEFAALVDGMESASSVVVLVDDLDRCLPEKVIDTFEAIRLFLSTPGTAFVIAADERVVRDAVRHRYGALSGSETNIAQDYLEKLVQVPLRIPPLVPAAAESYCNLLVSQRGLSEDDFVKVVSAAVKIRSEGELSVACNLGIVREALGDGELPEQAERDLGLIARIIGPLTVGLKGNPRQIKRFLNAFDLRRRTAYRRELEIDESILAKLTVLEYVKDQRFRELHAWQSRGAGVPSEVAEFEAHLDGDEDVPLTNEASAWISDPWLRDWINTEPRLKGQDLSTYFFLARDQLGYSSDLADQLPPSLQGLLDRLSAEVTSVREAAVEEASGLELSVLSLLIDAASARLKGLQDKQPMMRSLVEIGERHPSIIHTIFTAFGQLPYPSVPIDVPLLVATRLKGDEERGSVLELLDVWETQSTSGPLSKSAMRARQALQRSNGNV